MKTPLFFVVCLLLCTSGFSQNVGIGTANPVFKLDVRNGSINTDSVYRIRASTILSAPNISNLFIGHQVGLTVTGTDNTFAGYQAGYSSTTGSDNSFYGSGAGYFNTTARANSFFGAYAGYLNAGNFNSFFGNNAGTNNGFGINNSFFGQAAGNANSDGYENSFFGRESGYSNATGYSNSFFGMSAGYANTIGYENSFFGRESGYSNTSGLYNSFFGVGAGYSNTTGTVNSFFGGYAGFINTSGITNSFFGYRAGVSNITGSQNTAVGYNANVSTSALTNATAIGYNAIVNADNKIRLGNSSVTVIEGQVAYSFPSDGRFKTNVTETVKGLDFIMKLRPVVYNLQAGKMDAFISGSTSTDASFASHNYTDIESMRQSGFIAQEVEHAAKATGYDFNGVTAPENETGTYSLAYSQFVVPLVKAVQEQQTMIENQSKMINMLLKEIKLLKENRR